MYAFRVQFGENENDGGSYHPYITTALHVLLSSLTTLILQIPANYITCGKGLNLSPSTVFRIAAFLLSLGSFGTFF